MPDISALNSTSKRVLRALFKDFYAISYGAVGDGVTDDASAIQTAIDAAIAAGGGTVVLSGGTFITSAALQISGDNITVYIDSSAVLKANSTNRINMISFGVGGTTVYKNCGVSGHGKIDANSHAERGIYFHGPLDHVFIEDVEITGTVGNIAGGGNAGDAVHLLGTDTSANFLTNYTLRDVLVHDCDEGILLEKTRYGLVSNCRVYDMNSQDCFETSSSWNVTFIGCFSRNPGTGNSLYDIYEDSRDILVVECQGIKTDNKTGIYAVDVGGITLLPQRVTFRDVILTAIVPGAQGAGPFAGSFTRGYSILNGATDINIQGGAVVGACYDVNSSAVTNDSAGRVKIDGTLFDTSGTCHIRNTRAAADLDIRNCTFKDWCFVNGASYPTALDFGNVSATSINLSGNIFRNTLTTKNSFYYINSVPATSIPFIIEDNDMGGGLASGGSGTPIGNYRVGMKFGRNRILGQGASPVEANYGGYYNSSSVAIGNTSVNVGTGIPFQVDVNSIVITPLGDPAASSVTAWWPTVTTSGQFTLNVTPAVVAATFNFAWKVLPQN